MFRTPIFSLLVVVVGLTRQCDAVDEVSFSRDVLPILSDRCFHCHGPDETHREADLRLDDAVQAMADRDGHAAIVPGNPDASELLKRVISSDPDVVMPPPDSHRRSLSVREVDLLRQWIAEGAPWGRHWAFEKPVRPHVPDPDVHPIDAFVRRRLQLEGLRPAARAPGHTLVRRLSFDLTGLPPTMEEVDEFASGAAPEAWEELIDRLLASEHYGERMAMWWLDAARYSDTDGYQGDATRTNWPWRDWVIDAFNQNRPFDEFTIEQFAGDLLPDATVAQRLATCFHRNHMTNGEGGRDPEESRIDYVIDRINTTGTVWLGLTLGCAQCHSHKFDPISQQDYYSLFAYFNSIDEDGKAGGAARPYLQFKSPRADRALAEATQVVDQRRETEAAARRLAEEQFEPWLAERLIRVKDGFQPWHVLVASRLESVEGTRLNQESDGTIQASGPSLFQDDYRLTAPVGISRVTALRLEVMPHHSHTAGRLSPGKTGEFILTDVKLQLRRRGQSQLRDIEIASAVADAEKTAKGRAYGNVRDTLDDDPRNGWTTESHSPEQPHVAVFALDQPLAMADDEELVFVMLHRSTDGDANIGRFRVSVTDQRGAAVRSLDAMPLEELAAAKPDDAAAVDDTLRSRLLDQFLTDHSDYQRARAELDRSLAQLAELKKAAGDLNVMVLAERAAPRPTHILVRGAWDQKGDEVGRAIPDALGPADRKDDSPVSASRLDLARWLVSRDNPLTARVVVNHLWQLCFGAGLVRTPEDFGLQGDFPTHPELLDWLAVELIESNWDLQHLLRLIVTSDTYQQSSVVTPELLERDPDNRLLAHGARYRLPSWMIRDAALRSGGLLNPSVGGPPVRPYQPPGVWAEMFMGRFRYEPSQGPAQYRRSLYAFWRRSAAPTFLFDSAQRRVCEVRPRLTNTPLQALTLLNDLSIREASRELAASVLLTRDASVARIEEMFRRVLSRAPTPDETQVLSTQLQAAIQYYDDSPAEARVLLDFGQPERKPSQVSPEFAAYTLVASMIFNLDEAITHE